MWVYVVNVVCGLIGLSVAVGLEIGHTRLEKGGRQPAVIRELILFGWPRTLSITGSAALTVVMLLAAFRPA